jgi:hypothetical protein
MYFIRVPMRFHTVCACLKGYICERIDDD